MKWVGLKPLTTVQWPEPEGAVTGPRWSQPTGVGRPERSRFSRMAVVPSISKVARRPRVFKVRTWALGSVVSPNWRRMRLYS